MISEGILHMILWYLRHGTEEVLAGGLKAGEETADEVGAHEGKGELVVVLEVNLPEGVLLGLVVLPEPRESTGAGVLVGVLALPVVENKGGAAESLERMLGPEGLNGLLLLLLSLLLGRLGGSFLLGSSRLGLLLGGSILDGLITELEVVSGRSVVLLAADELEPPGGVRVRSAELLVENLGNVNKDAWSMKSV